MNYRETNKEAWEEAFDNRKDNWGDNLHVDMNKDNLPFLHSDIAKEVRQMNLEGKTIGHFCCNNGRELLSLMQLKPKKAVGFDIAENIIEQANGNAKRLNVNCDFVACDILDIDSKYYNQFDMIFVSVGAITWFKDLKELFEVVNKCLKPDGTFLIHEIHPVAYMLPIPGDKEFDQNNLNKVEFSYFKDTPWIENTGINYMGDSYKSKTFTSFTHPISTIINSLIKVGFTINKFDEFNHDIELTNKYDDLGLFPLSFLLLASK